MICKEDYLSFAIGGRDYIFGREIMRSRNWMRSKATLKIATMMRRFRKNAWVENLRGDQYE